jgi:hypothetical protein
LEGSTLLVDLITNHKNLEYFSTMNLLTWQQAQWSKFVSQFHLIIQFRPWKLGTKLATLTRRWDIYLKEGGNDYGQVNSQNFRHIFTNQQLLESLRATSLLGPAVQVSMIMDSEKLHANILAHLASDL